MTNAIEYLTPASSDNFDEAAYLEANPDVADAVAAGLVETGDS
jgi:hypothetical protein